MHRFNNTKQAALAVLLMVGVVGGGWVSYKHMFTDQACPILAGVVPACYVVLVSYLLMTIGFGVGLKYQSRTSTVLFWTGLLIASSLAVVASLFELFGGDICPRLLGWLPMCYLSLVACIAIMTLYMTTRHHQTTPARRI